MRTIRLFPAEFVTYSAHCDDIPGIAPQRLFQLADVDVYRFVMDIDESALHLQTEEIDGYMFATVDEIKAFAAEGKFLHYDSIKKAFE